MESKPFTNYEGELCDAIVRTSNYDQGLLSQKDFKDHLTTWVEPVSTKCCGSTILVMDNLDAFG
jgi:gamma-glutamyltranspeptidase